MSHSQNSQKLDSQSSTSPFNPDNWEPAEVVPNTSPGWAATVSEPSARSKPSPESLKSNTTSLQTARTSTAPRTAKGNSSYSMARNASSTRKGVTQTPSFTTTAAPGESSSQKEREFHFGPDFGLKLNQKTLALIRADFTKRKTRNGRQLSNEEVAALTTIEAYGSHLETHLHECGQYLDEMLGGRFVLIGEARKALEQVVSMGIISTEEVILSPDCEKITNAAHNDVITVHSLSNVIRKILNNRRNIF